MYEIIYGKYPYMEKTEIMERFDGEWIYLVNCDVTEFNGLIGGTPAVIADRPFGGGSDEDGRIYDQFELPKYGEDFAMDLRHNVRGLFTTGFPEIMPKLPDE